MHNAEADYRAAIRNCWRPGAYWRQIPADKASRALSKGHKDVLRELGTAMRDAIWREELIPASEKGEQGEG